MAIGPSRATAYHRPINKCIPQELHIRYFYNCGETRIRSPQASPLAKDNHRREAGRTEETVTRYKVKKEL